MRRVQSAQHSIAIGSRFEHGPCHEWIIGTGGCQAGFHDGFPDLFLQFLINLFTKYGVFLDIDRNVGDWGRIKKRCGYDFIGGKFLLYLRTLSVHV